MAVPFIFKGKEVIEPGAYAEIVSGATERNIAASFGKVMVIDTGEFSSGWGGAGINGELTKKNKAIYKFPSANDFQKFIGGGLWSELASMLFNPSTEGGGIEELIWVSAKTSTASELALSFSASSAGTAATGSVKMKAVALTIGSGGTGHEVNDLITLTGGTFTQAIVLKVLTVASGVITSVQIQTAGSYSVLPTNPASQGSTTGTGIGATINITSWGIESVIVASGGTNFADVTPTLSVVGSPSATFEPTISNGIISSVAVLSGGAGYTVVPTISFVRVTGGGDLMIKTKIEGFGSIGALTALNNLYKGFGVKIKAGVLDSSKFVMEFYQSQCKGIDINVHNFTKWTNLQVVSAGNIREFLGIAYKCLSTTTAGESPYTTPSKWAIYDTNITYFNNDGLTTTHLKLLESVEFSTLEELVAWMTTSSKFNTYFQLTDSTITGNGGIVSADLLSYIDMQIFEGGTESYGTQDFADVLANIGGEDNTYFFSDKMGANVLDTKNLQILAHINSGLKYDKYLLVAGAYNEDDFETNTLAAAQYFNTSKVALVHGGGSLPKSGGGDRLVSQMYTAAAALGRTMGLAPQTPSTQKSIRVTDVAHVLTESERIRALKAGVIHFKKVGTSWVINEAVNTLQRNTSLFNSDGQSSSISIERIKAALNKILVINAEIRFPGGNLFTSSAQDVKSFTEKTLQDATITRTQDNLITGFRDVKVVLVQDAWQVQYGFGPNGPINKVFFRGVMQENNISI